MEEPLPRVRRGGNDGVSRTPLQPDAQYAWRDRIEMSLAVVAGLLASVMGRRLFRRDNQ